jgi:hypothetical protein
MIDINFEWSRSLAYEITGAGNMRWIQPVGKNRQRFEPFKIEGDTPLFLRFAQLDRSEESLLRFARAWGLLRCEKQSQGEFLRDWESSIDAIKTMATAFGAFDEQPGGELQRASPGTLAKVSELDVVLRAGPGRPTLVFKPPRLLEAMHLQLSTFIAGHGSLGACKSCGTWFERGGRDSRRSLAVYCSETCKNRFNNLRKRGKQ